MKDQKKDEGKIICFFKENGESFNVKLTYAFEEYLKESNENIKIDIN